MLYGVSNGHMPDDLTWTQKVKVVTQIYLEPNISKTLRDRGLTPMEHPWEMLYGAWNGNMHDDLTWPQKVKVVTQIYIEPNISKALGDRGLIPMEHQ